MFYYLIFKVEAQKEIGDLITKMKRAGESVGLHIIDKELQWKSENSFGYSFRQNILKHIKFYFDFVFFHVRRSLNKNNSEINVELLRSFFVYQANIQMKREHQVY